MACRLQVESLMWLDAVEKVLEKLRNSGKLVKVLEKLRNSEKLEVKCEEALR